MEHRIRVLLADDQSILADGIRSVLSSSGELEVVGIASDGFEALDLLEKCAPDVILMDIRMPNMNGVIATQEVKRRHPEVKVLILTTFDDSDYILNAINNGASGYLLKDTSAAALIDAIKNAYAGDTILPAKIARRIVDAARMVSSDREIKLKRRFGLSDREVEIAIMIYEGFTNKQIASALKLTDGTARNYISAIYEKIGSSSRIVELDKQAHKMLTACLLWQENSASLPCERRTAIARRIVEGGIADYLYRLIITDIKPPVFYRIKENPEHFRQLTTHVLKRLEPSVGPLGDFWLRLCQWHEQPPETAATPNDLLARRILAAAHMYASSWEFCLIRPVNTFDEEMEEIAASFRSRLDAFRDLAHFLSSRFRGNNLSMIEQVGNLSS